jgi:hypothetical protein
VQLRVSSGRKHPDAPGLTVCASNAYNPSLTLGRGRGTLQLKTFAATLVVGLWATSAALAGPTTVTIKVDALQRDAKGTHWDIRRGSPDLAICVSYKDFEDKRKIYTQCWPHRSRGRIATRMKDLKRPKCRNAYSCTFNGIVVPADDKFEVMVVDVDRYRHDMIGSGFFRVNKRCKVGRAEVTVRRATPRRWCLKRPGACNKRARRPPRPIEPSGSVDTPVGVC